MAAPELIEAAVVRPQGRSFLRRVTAIYDERISTKIIGLYVILLFVVAFVASYAVLFALTNSTNQQVYDSLAAKGIAVSNAMLKVEDTQLTVQRQMAFTVGVEDAILANDGDLLLKRLKPIQINTRTGYVDVFNAQGQRIVALRPPERDSEAATMIDNNAPNWKSVRFVLNGTVDELGDKYSELIRTAWGEDIIYSAGPVKKGDQVVGAILVGNSLKSVADRLSGESSGALITVYDDTREPIVTTVVNGLGILTGPTAEEREQLISNPAGVTSHEYQVDGLPLAEMFGILKIRNEPVAVLGVSQDISSAQASALQIRNLMILVFAVVATGVLALGVTLARSLTRPINALVRATESLRSGNMDIEVPIMSRDETGVLAREFNSMVEGLRERDKTRDAFGRYFSDDFYSLVQAGQLQLGGEKREITIVMSDIRSFTTLSETMDPTELVSFLNEYFTLQVDAIRRHGGEVDKYMGDAILAKFGAPVWYPDHARRAALAMLDMREALAIFNRRREERNEAPIRIGIGANTGMAIVGNIGSSARMEYTIIGDAVNATQRIEDLCKELRFDLLISDTVLAGASDVIEVGIPTPVTLRGRQTETLIYPLIGHKKALALDEGDDSTGDHSSNGTHPVELSKPPEQPALAAPMAAMTISDHDQREVETLKPRALPGTA